MNKQIIGRFHCCKAIVILVKSGQIKIINQLVVSQICKSCQQCRQLLLKADNQNNKYIEAREYCNY